MTARWGVIADDVTGACDVAAEVGATGLRVAVILGVPDARTSADDTDVIVAGLTTRTASRERAVRESVETARWMLDHGVSRIYQKYCSTFDSTDEGMIGPVAEALCDLLGAGSVGTPATPHARRTLYQGHLFVLGRLLSESSLQRHPLTPMTDPDLVRVLERQASRPVELIEHEIVRAGGAALRDAVLARSRFGHTLVDALDEHDLDAIAEALLSIEHAEGTTLVGGGAGLITAIARSIDHPRTRIGATAPGATGPALVLVGSASDQTARQVAASGIDPIALDALAVHDDAGELSRIISTVHEHLTRHGVALVSATSDREALTRAQSRLGIEPAAHLVEKALGAIARAAVGQANVERLIIAGGETSGAVTAALGIARLDIEHRVDPGVAWATAAVSADLAADPLRVLLKSGNFGADDLITRAIGGAS